MVGAVRQVNALDNLQYFRLSGVLEATPTVSTPILHEGQAGEDGQPLQDREAFSHLEQRILEA